MGHFILSFFVVELPPWVAVLYLLGTSHYLSFLGPARLYFYYFNVPGDGTSFLGVSYATDVDRLARWVLRPWLSFAWLLSS
jgi:hypothetical protein